MRWCGIPGGSEEQSPLRGDLRPRVDPPAPLRRPPAPGRGASAAAAPAGGSSPASPRPRRRSAPAPDERPVIRQRAASHPPSARRLPTATAATFRTGTASSGSSRPIAPRASRAVRREGGVRVWALCHLRSVRVLRTHAAKLEQRAIVSLDATSGADRRRGESGQPRMSETVSARSGKASGAKETPGPARSMWR